MKKIITLISSVSLVVLPFLVSAATTTTIMPTNDPTVGEGMSISMVETPIAETLTNVANYVIGGLLLLAVFYVLWAAYTFITSNGEAEKLSTARSRIMYAGIGVVVALLAKGIVSLVLSAVQ